MYQAYKVHASRQGTGLEAHNRPRTVEVIYHEVDREETVQDSRDQQHARPTPTLGMSLVGRKPQTNKAQDVNLSLAHGLQPEVCIMTSDSPCAVQYGNMFNNRF